MGNGLLGIISWRSGRGSTAEKSGWQWNGATGLPREASRIEHPAMRHDQERKSWLYVTLAIQHVNGGVAIQVLGCRGVCDCERGAYEAGDRWGERGREGTWDGMSLRRVALGGRGIPRGGVGHATAQRS